MPPFVKLLSLAFAMVPSLWGMPLRMPLPYPPIAAPATGSVPMMSAAVAAPSAAQAEWTFHKSADGSRPSGREQEYIWLMNRARSNPRMEGRWLAGLADYWAQMGMDYFDVLRDVLVEEFEDFDPTPPAAPDIRIMRAATDHSQYMITVDAQTHEGQFDRIRAEGYPLNGGRASVFAYSEYPLMGHAAFNIDWGVIPEGDDGTGMQVGRGHRMGLMGDYVAVGVGILDEVDPDTVVGPQVTTINYGNPYGEPDQFCVGTVWEDLNRNGVYDAGEGLAGVEVRPDRGAYYAVTGDAGGYAFPITDGAFGLHFSGGSLTVPRNLQVVAEGGRSVLVRWINPEPAAPPAVRLRANGTGLPQAFELQSWVLGRAYWVERSANLQSWDWEWLLPLGGSFWLAQSWEYVLEQPVAGFYRFVEGGY